MRNYLITFYILTTHTHPLSFNWNTLKSEIQKFDIIENENSEFFNSINESVPILYDDSIDFNLADLNLSSSVWILLLLDFCLLEILASSIDILWKFIVNQ